MDFFKLKDLVLSGKDVSELNYDDLNDYSVYMMNRWASMKDVSSAIIVNGTVNKYWNLYDDKMLHAKTLSGCMSAGKYVKYIKKNKEERTKEDKEVMEIMCKNLEISMRELKMYIEEFNVELPSLKK